MHRHIATRAIIALFGIGLVSCDNSAAPNDGQTYQPPYAPLFMIEADRNQQRRLAERIEAIENIHNSAEFKLSDGGFDYVETSLGPAPFQWTDSAPHGDGTKITAKIGNSTRAKWNRIKIYGLVWDKNLESVRVIQAQISQSVDAGKWKSITFQIDNISPEKIEKINISNISIQSLELDR